MGGGSTEQNTTQQSVQTTQLPPWVNQAAQQNYALAQQVAARPLTQYQGQQVANIGPQMQQAWNLAASSGAAGADQYNAAQGAFLTAAGTPYLKVTPQSLAGTSLAPYLNPYTQDVINKTLPLMQQQLGINQIGNQSAAAGAGAFGGSRLGIQQGVTQAQGALGMAQMAAQLNQANFSQAQAAATGDIQRDLQAQTSNQGANQQNINSLIQAGSGLAGLGNAAQQNQRQQFLELDTAGQQEQQQAQNQINAQIAQFNQANNYPLQQMGILQSALGMTPYGSSTTGSSAGQTVTQTNPSIAGDIMGGLQALGSLGGLFPASSDRNLKTDISKVGVHKPSGLPIYSYRYKGDPKSYPKVSGPMAEDVMKVAPHAVTTVGVHPSGQAMHGVDFGALNAAPPFRPRRPAGRVPGALTPVGPQGAMGPMGANMRAPRMRQPMRMPMMPGPMAGGM